MNNDAPETLAAARSRAADLEQQLKLSDEGVSRLAQRCLELEQQVLNYQAALARHGSDNEPLEGASPPTTLARSLMPADRGAA